MNKSIDILIIGGGLIGATLLLALRGLGYSTVLVESKELDKLKPNDFDARSLALSLASQRILKTLGVWDALSPHASPIETIHVSNQGYFGTAKLEGKKNNPLGYVLEMEDLNQALYQTQQKEELLMGASLTALDCEHRTARVCTQSGELTLHPQLIVAADGAQSLVRRFCDLTAEIKSYEQEALVANIGIAKAHEACAYERFTADGPLALLPMQGKRMSLIWALPPDKAKQFLVDEVQCLKELQLAFGYRLGRFSKMGKRSLFPLKQVIMPEVIKWPFVFVGNAAHSLHPVAGQGFNLGLRDVATLAQCIAQWGLKKAMLDEYHQLRQRDQRVISGLTDGLISLYTSALPGMGYLRNLGLIAFDNISVFKHLLIRYSSGFGGLIPDLVCEMALNSGKCNESV